MRLFICGFSGAGKTTLATLVAERLEIPAMDTDNVLANGKNLAECINEWGFVEFRRKEIELIMRLSGGLKGDSLVISLGGGSLTEASVDATKSKGNKLAWLDTDFSKCWERIEGDSGRPLVVKGKSELARIYEERLPLYRQANIRVSGATAVDELVAYMASFEEGNDYE